MAKIQPQDIIVELDSVLKLLSLTVAELSHTEVQLLLNLWNKVIFVQIQYSYTVGLTDYFSLQWNCNNERIHLYS